MSDQKKTKAQLIEELNRLRARLSEAESDTHRECKALFESSAEGILIADEATQRLVDVNAAACRMFGYERERLRGMDLREIHPPEAVELARQHFRAMKESREVEVHALPCLKSDGSVFYADIRVGRVTVDNHPCVAGFFRDATKTRQEFNLAKLQRDLAVNLNLASDLDAALRSCLETAIEASGMDSGGIYLVDQVSGALDLKCHSGLSEDFINTCSHYEADSPNTRLVMSKRPYYQSYSHITRDLGVAERSERLRALAVIPVVHLDRVIACMNIASHTFDDFSPQARLVLEGIAATIGSTLSRLTTEQALRLRETFSLAVIANSPIGISIRSADNELLSVNTAWMKIWGVSQEDVENYKRDSRTMFIGEPSSLQLGPWLSQVERIFREGGTLRIPELHYLAARPARARWVSLTYYSVPNERGEVDRVVILTEDITERKQTEDALQSSEERWQFALEGAGDGVWDWNAVTNEVTFSRQWKNMLGYEDHEIGSTLDEWDKRVHPDDKEAIYAEIKKHFNGETPTYVSEHRVLCKDGSYKWILDRGKVISRTSDGQPLRVIGTHTDITEHKKIEAALRDGEARIGSILSAAPIGIGLTANRIILHVNHALCDLLGYSPEELVNQSARILYPTNEDFDFVGREKYAQIRERGTGTVETRWLRKDGGIIQVLLSSTPLNRDDWSKGITFTALDITERKQAEETIRTAEEKYRTLVNNLPVAVYRSTPDGRVLSANPAMVQMYGYDSEEDYCSKPAWDSYLARQVHEQFLHELRQNGSVSGFQGQMVRKDGKIIWVSVNAIAHKNNDGEIEYIDGTEEDITELRAAETALAESEERYRQIVEASPFGMHMYILQPDGQLVFEGANPAADWILRIDHSHLKGKTIEEAFPALVGTEVPEQFRRIARHGERWRADDFEYDDGRIKVAYEVVAFQRSPMKMAALFKDITERRRADEEIRKFKTISDNAAYGTHIVSPDGILLYVNKAFADMHGCSIEELIGRPLSTCHTERQLASVSSGMREVLGGTSFTSREVWHLHRDGTEFPTLMSGTVIADSTGKPQYLAATTVDTTELKRLQEFADRARRLEAAGQIAGQVAHDFNNLLGPLVAYPDLIRDELGEAHPVNAYLEPIETAARQMAEINQQLLTLGRRGHYQQEPVNLNEIIRQLLHQLESQYPQVTISTSLAADLLNIYGGVAQLGRVLTNLLTNAVDAMKGTGTITVSTENWYADEPQGKYRQIARGEYVKMTLTDTGCGIPAEVMPRVFEPFFTTKKADRRRGSGLGLSVVHAVVEDHKGYVDIESTVDCGTSVYLYFPITRQEVVCHDEGIAGGNGETILVVDDDEVQRNVSVRLLQKLGYQAEAVDSGEAALERLLTQQFDVLVLDMVMGGGLDGVGTYRLAREQRPDQKAVIVSGYAESAHVAEALRIGAGEFVRKPLSQKTLAAAIRRELERRPAPTPAA